MNLATLTSRLPRIFVTRPILSLTVLRVIVGLIFVKEGTGKLFGWFDHGGLEITGAYFREIGIPVPEFSAILVGCVEAACGGCLIAGVLTRLVVVPLAAVMLVAIVTVHASVGYSYPLLICASLFILGQSGGGSFSIDLYLSGKPFSSLALFSYTKLKHRS